MTAAIIPMPPRDDATVADEAARGAQFGWVLGTDGKEIDYVWPGAIPAGWQVLQFRERRAA